VNTPGARLVSILLFGLLALSWLALPVQGSSHPTGNPPSHLASDCRTARRSSGPGEKTGAARRRPITAPACAALSSTGAFRTSGVTLRLGDGGWEVVQITSADGRYGFGSLAKDSFS